MIARMTKRLSAPAEEDKDALSQLRTEPVNILVVDDLPEKLLAYESILEELGQNIVMARTGEEALKLVLSQEFAVILLDVNMPGMDGLETAMLIRRRKKSAHTPIIFLTAFSDEIRMAQGYASGAVDYLPTPVVPGILQAKVKVFVELAQMRKQAALQAEEHAKRKAAEEDARRLEFLVDASEAFARAQGTRAIMQALIQMATPYLADYNRIWILDKDTQQLRLYGVNVEGEYISDPQKLAQITPVLESYIRKVLKTGQPQLVDGLSESNFFPHKKPAGEEFGAMAILLPLVVKDYINAVFVLVSRTHFDNLRSATLSLANALISRAVPALENAILMERIKESDRRKDEFLAMLAHELRNPLAPIKGAVDALKMNTDEEIRSQLEDTIERQTNHMVHLVDDLMDVSRITQNKIELRKEKIELSNIISHAIETSHPLIRQHRHRLITDIPDNAIWMEADFSRLSQIFSNLLNNAAKYTDAEGVIEIRVRNTGNSAVISVKDNGIGIPEDKLQSIFDMFSQVDNSLERSHGGLGIGLTLVRKLVEMHGGTISALSAGAGTGSEFVVTLPTSSEQVEHMNDNRVYESSDVSENPLRIMIVDDNESLVQVMELTVKLLGHNTCLATDGVSAIERAREFRPEIVLMDIGLPGMNGYDVCKIMKKDPLFANTLFVAQTGWGQEEHRKRSQEAGFEHHLVKPASMKDLQEVINSYNEKKTVADGDRQAGTSFVPYSHLPPPIYETLVSEKPR